jgi:hypothetical protein
VGCGYDLRGSPAHGNCPECGVDVWRSLHGGRLDHVDPKWLAKVVWGQTLIYWSWIVFAILAVVVVAGGVGLIAFFANRSPPIGVDVGLVLAVGTFNVALVLASVGAAMAATPENRDSNVERANHRRRIARWGFATCTSVFILIETRQSAWFLGNASEVMLLIALVPAWMASASCYLSFLAGCARRLSRDNVGAQIGDTLASCAALTAVLSGGLLIFGCLLAIGVASRPTTAPFVLVPLILLALPLGLTIMVGHLGSALAMRDLQTELKHALNRARAAKI